MEPASPSPAAPDAGPASCRGDRALPLVLVAAAVLVAAVLALFRPTAPPVDPHAPDAPSSASASWSPSPRPAGETVSLAIDFGNGARREFDALPYVPGMTLADLMEQARGFRPPVAFTMQGEGKMAFLTSLEGVANETGGGRYWLYSVDGNIGETSYAVQPLAPGAAVLWEFRRGE